MLVVILIQRLYFVNIFFIENTPLATLVNYS